MTIKKKHDYNNKVACVFTLACMFIVFDLPNDFLTFVIITSNVRFLFFSFLSRVQNGLTFCSQNLSTTKKLCFGWETEKKGDILWVGGER